VCVLVTQNCWYW